MDSNTTLSLATFNIRTPCDPAPNDWEARIPRIRAVIQRHAFDIVGLQEATWQQLERLLADADDRWDVIGEGRDDGHHGGELSGILYRKDRLKLQATRTFWLSETPDVPGSRSWNTACTRICTWGRFTDLKTGKPFVHFNTHLDHRSQPAQLNGVRVILDAIRALPADLPVVLTGDFNVYPDSQVVAETAAVLRNAASCARDGYHCPPYTYHAYGTWQLPAPDRRCEIDYIFVSDAITVHRVDAFTDTCNGLYPSDHFPLRALLEL